jgi:hypothetical protein
MARDEHATEKERTAGNVRPFTPRRPSSPPDIGHSPARPGNDRTSVDNDDNPGPSAA